jgi:hypothetical protein
MLSRAAAVAFSILLCLSVCTPAHADESCRQYDKNTGLCVVDGHDGSGDKAPRGKRGKPTPSECVDSTFSNPARVVPCSGPLGDWNNAYQCYLKLYDGESTDSRELRHFHCFSPAYAGGIDRFMVTIVWTGPLVDPEAVAREVVASLQLRAIHIGLAPRAGSTGLVQLPVWMWTDNPDSRTWGPASASKTVQGLTVNVRAEVDSVDWDMGDGTTVNCGVGTPRPAGGGTSGSPNCGHTYTSTSATTSGGVFTVTATSHWTINWTAGDQHGSFPFELSDATQLTIIESRPVLTAP